MNLAERIGYITNLIAQRKDLNTQVKELTEKLEAAEAELIAAIKEQGLSSIKVCNFTATVSSTNYGSIEDFEKFSEYVIENKALYLLQRRLIQPSIEELRKIEGEIPGVAFFKKESLSLRKN